MDHNKRRKKSRSYRLSTDRHENYPNGYVEDCSICSSVSSSISPIKPPNSSSTTTAIPSIYRPTSLILSTTTNLILDAASSYQIRFSTGISDGIGFNINEEGNIITCLEDGFYRFEICGEAILFSDVNVKLIFESDKFSSDFQPFTETDIPKDEGKLNLRGIATILPLQKDQTIQTRLKPHEDESIVLCQGTRLLIHRVA